VAAQEAVDELPVVPLALGEQNTVPASAASKECRVDEPADGPEGTDTGAR
jgi:hypothetical protein